MQPTAAHYEEIENPLTRNVRYLDELVDELARRKYYSYIGD